MTELLSIAVALAAGLLMTRLFKKLGFNFPDVTAFLVAGLCIGPYGLGRLGITGLGFPTFEDVDAVNTISSVALGFIAFSIGNEFKLSHLEGTGRQATVIGILQAVTAMVMVDIVLVMVSLLAGADKLSIPAAITLGAIATATAPAATLMVVKQYKAKGKLTDILLPVVALDDAVGLVAFALSFGIAQTLITNTVSIVAIIVNPLVEIVASLLLGSLMGVVLTKLEELFYSNSNRLSLTIAFVLITIAISSMSFDIGPINVSFSSLLVCMMLGTMLCNLCPRSGDIMSRADQWTAPLFALFFVISGADFNLSVFKSPIVVLIGILYVLARSFGKYFGARESAKATGCDQSVVKYLGYTLLPQAGVALGMCVTAETLGSYDGLLIRNIVLFSVFIYEIAGPMITKWALTKSGDIEQVPGHKTSHDRFDAPKSSRKQGS